MTVALVTRVELPPLPGEDELDRAVAWIRRLAGLGRPLAVAVPGRVWHHLAEGDGSPPEGEIEWLRVGWGEPDLTVLPDAARSLQLARESEALNAVGLDPTGFFTFTWDPTIVPTLLDHGIDHAVVVGGDSFGAADRFDRALPVFSATRPPVESPPDANLRTILVDDPEAALTHLEGVALTTPGRHLADHPPPTRLRPTVNSPAFRPEPADPASELLYRKMLRLTAVLGERPPTAAVAHTLEAQHRLLYPGPVDPTLRLRVHRSLLAARRLVDRRRRGDGWTTVERLDWDADGREELEIESAWLSLVVDPAAGRVLYLDDKAGDWPTTATPDDGEPGIVLARLLGADDVPWSVPLPTVQAAEERRGGARVVVDGRHEQGNLSVTLTTEGSVLRLGYRLRNLAEARIGPELPFAFLPGIAEMRVDGGEWLPVGGPVAAAGHRFRFSDGERQVLVVMPIPGDCFARPLEPFGVVVWAHWPAGGDGDYELTVDLAP